MSSSAVRASLPPRIVELTGITDELLREEASASRPLPSCWPRS